MCNISLVSSSWFHSFLLQITLCFSFGTKDMITAFTCLPSYRYHSFILWAYLCWRHTYCERPIIELAMNVSLPLAMWSRFIHMLVFRGVKKMANLYRTVCRTNRKHSSFITKHFQRKSRKIFDLHLPLRRLVSFVARINTWKVRCWVTDTQTHRPSTVTLAAHARRGLTILEDTNEPKVAYMANTEVRHTLRCTNLQLCQHSICFVSFCCLISFLDYQNCNLIF